MPLDPKIEEALITSVLDEGQSESVSLKLDSHFLTSFNKYLRKGQLYHKTKGIKPLLLIAKCTDDRLLLVELIRY